MSKDLYAYIAVISFLSGVAVGNFMSFIFERIDRKRQDAEYKEQMEFYLDSKAAWEEWFEKNGQLGVDAVDGDDEEEKDETPRASEQPDNVLRFTSLVLKDEGDEGVDEDGPDYEEDPDFDEEYEAAVAAEDLDNEVKSVVKRDRPYVITAEQFSDANYDTVSLYYYADDDILTEESHEEIITDIENTVGRDCLDLLRDLDHRSILWVRNDRLELDYEILRLLGGYGV